MTLQPVGEPWMANGFPPPSFEAEPEPERARALGALRSRWTAAALLGAILLLAGILLVTGGDDGRTALTAGPPTTAPGGLDIGPGSQRTFPASSALDPAAAGVEATTPPTFPFGTYSGTVVPSSSAPATASTTTTSRGGGGGGGGTQTSTSTARSTTPSTSTSTTAAVAPTKITPGAGSSYVQPVSPATSPCDGEWSVQAKVEGGTRIESARVAISRNGGASVPMEMTPVDPAGNRTGIWTTGPLPMETSPAEVTLSITATGAPSAGVETFRC